MSSLLLVRHGFTALDPVVRHAAQRTATRLFMSKVATSAAEALKQFAFHKATVSIGGFGTCGVPETLVKELSRSDEASELTLVGLDSGPDGCASSRLVEAGKAKKLITSYIGESKSVLKRFFDGSLLVELVPQGTIAERLVAGGSGTPAFLSKTGVGTLYANGGIPVRYKSDGSNEVETYSTPKELYQLDGKDYIVELALRPDYAFVKAFKADTLGNLVFHGTNMNSNPDAAKAGNVCIAEVDEIVPAGQLKPDEIHVPGIYVDRVVRSLQEQRIQKKPHEGQIDLNKDRILRRLAKEFKDGMYVNLGIGIPTGASNYIPNGLDVEIHTENGMLGVGRYNEKGDTAWVNAAKEPVLPVKGASSFSSSASFEIVRGGHLDMTALGGFQVSEHGDLANWMVPGKFVPGMGGAMDLVGSGSSRVIVTMMHVCKDGTHKILPACTYPLTGKQCVDTVITDMATFRVTEDGLLMTDIASGLTVDDIRRNTGCDFKVADDLGVMDDAMTIAEQPSVSAVAS